MLMDQIIQAKQGSQADMLSLLQQFQPILKKYGRKLWGEGGAGPRDGDQQAKRQSDQAAGLRKTPAAVGNRGISKQPLLREAAYFTMEFVRDLE